MNQRLHVLSLALVLVPAQTSFATDAQKSVVTRTEGKAELMIKKVPNAPAPSGTQAILFEKQSYFLRTLKPGDRPGNGDIIKTGKDGFSATSYLCHGFINRMFHCFRRYNVCLSPELI